MSDELQQEEIFLDVEFLQAPNIFWFNGVQYTLNEETGEYEPPLPEIADVKKDPS